MRGQYCSKKPAQFLTPGCANPSIPIKQQNESTSNDKPSLHPSFCSVNSTTDTEKGNVLKNETAAVFDGNGVRVDKKQQLDHLNEDGLIMTDSFVHTGPNNKLPLSPIKCKTPNQKKFNENNRQSSVDEIDFPQDFAENRSKNPEPLKLSGRHRRKSYKKKKYAHLSRSPSTSHNINKKPDTSTTTITTQTDLDTTREKIVWNKELNENVYQNHGMGDNPFSGKQSARKPTSKFVETRNTGGFYDILEQLKAANEDGTIRCVVSSAVTFILLIWLIAEILHIKSPRDLLGLVTDYLSNLPIFARKYKYVEKLTTAELAIQYFGNIIKNFFDSDKN